MIRSKYLGSEYFRKLKKEILKKHQTWYPLIKTWYPLSKNSTKLPGLMVPIFQTNGIALVSLHGFIRFLGPGWESGICSQGGWLVLQLRELPDDSGSVQKDVRSVPVTTSRETQHLKMAIKNLFSRNI